jgi:flagellar basal body-associated protein FliL
MDTSVLIWIIIGVIVVALIVVGAVFLMRGRTEQRRRAEHDKAEKLRAQARESELAAREGEARAAQVKADAATAAAEAQQAKARAAQAEIDANRLSDSVGEHEAEAAKRRAEQEEALRKAADVDPYVTAGGTATGAAAGTAGAGRADLDRDGRADAAENRDLDRDGRADAAENRDLDRDGHADAGETRPTVDKDGQPLTRPPASKPVPTVAQSDTAVDSQQQQARRGNADRV